ncbi:DUF5337 family protein [Rhodovulum sp. YNF3179]|uniref:DUF5337 family protein n=1 Tax=Rhodovulum sp. YNF3179 TaxID=3425127 RepID=UPI003D338023
MAQRDDNGATRAETRLAAIVIIATMALWMGASYLGGRLGLPVRFAFLIDLAALAAFFWALVVLFRVWRKRQEHGE